MQRLQWVLLVSFGAVSLTGCSFFSSGETAVVSDAPIQAPSEAAETPVSDGEAFADPVVESTPATLTSASPDLIRSTDPDERARQVQRSRPDPFATLIPPTPLPIALLPEGGDDAIASRRPLPEKRSDSGGSTSIGSSQPSLPSPGRAATGASSPSAAAKPPAPQPTMARTVSVSGVVQVDGETYAIVRVPNEPERYVRQGDRIANNRVLVKQIDIRAAEPRIVLEENGIEVVMAISEAAVATDGQPAAGPTSPLPVVPLPDLATLPTLNNQ